MIEVYEHYKYRLSPMRRGNLEKLARFLEHRIEPPKFDMSSFMTFEGRWVDNMVEALEAFYDEFEEKGDQTAVYNHCGTSACAVGHGPLAGIPIKKREDWVDYANRVFINQSAGSGGETWSFLFSGDWKDHDNTPIGAAARIWYLFENGTPVNRYGEVDHRNIGFYQDYKLGGSKHPDAVKEAV